MRLLLAALAAVAALLCALTATAEQLSLEEKIASALSADATRKKKNKGSGHETTTASPTLQFPVTCLCPCAFGPGACNGDLQGTPDCLACLAANPYACHATPTGC